ncbi:hypothetical protein QP735_04205 [Curtobacterium citreum]|uniref:hypothetical protein n=1 Tax=Curtobacterium citreum TaxID=2036 RepID=UPI00254FEF76|nr:hypothetical protein [Curtobacterium citreum]MDK8171726.1 hypothetical protein [Curtobacterium citreum]
MTDSVDTGALRDLQALSGGILSRNLLKGSGVWKINRDVARALGAAADEVDRLRAVIEKAPHDTGCATPAEQLLGVPRDPEQPCTCWKAEVP